METPHVHQLFYFSIPTLPPLYAAGTRAHLYYSAGESTLRWRREPAVATATTLSPPPLPFSTNRRPSSEIAAAVVCCWLTPSCWSSVWLTTCDAPLAETITKPRFLFSYNETVFFSRYACMRWTVFVQYSFIFCSSCMRFLAWSPPAVLAVASFSAACPLKVVNLVYCSRTVD